jgi:hypothetical protein
MVASMPHYLTIFIIFIIFIILIIIVLHPTKVYIPKKHSLRILYQVFLYFYLAFIRQMTFTNRKGYVVCPGP